MTARTYRPIDESIRNDRGGTGPAEQPHIRSISRSPDLEFLPLVAATLWITGNPYEMHHICVQV